MPISTKMIMLAYNEAVDDEVMDLLEECGIRSYTKITKAFGKGALSGTHLGNDIWPGFNNILHIACSGEDAKVLTEKVRSLRETLGKEGVKAFVMPIEEIT